MFGLILSKVYFELILLKMFMIFVFVYEFSFVFPQHNNEDFHFFLIWFVLQ